MSRGVLLPKAEPVIETPVLMLTAAIGVAVFLLLLRYAYPSEASKRPLATRQEACILAAAAVRRLCGLDVTGWRVFAVVGGDSSIVEDLYRRDSYHSHRETVERWGVRCNWQVRFISDRATVLVGLAPGGEVTAFELHRDASDLDAMSGQPPTEREMRRQLNGSMHGIWTDVARCGRGEYHAEDGAVKLYERFRLRVRDFRVDLLVATRGSAIVQVTSKARLVGEHAASGRTQVAEELSGTGGTLGTLLAVITGVTLMALTDVAESDEVESALILAGCLAAAVLVAVLAVDPSDFPYTAVNTYENGTPWAIFRMIAFMGTLVSGLVMSGVTAVAATAGYFSAARADIPVLVGLLGQMAWGGWLAACWLGIAVGVWAVLRRSGLASHLPELDERVFHREGPGVGHAVAVAVQSSIGEEVVYRLLVLPVVVWVSGWPWLGVLVSAVLWALMHSGSGVRPRWARFAELAVVGCGLGAAMLAFGFVSVLVAHALFNAVMLLVPQVSLPATGRQPEPSEVTQSTATR